MFNKKRRFDIRRDGKDYIYNFTTSTGIQYDIRFEYVRAGVCHLKCKNLTDTSSKIWNYRDNTSIEFFSTLIAVVEDFNELILPDEMMFSFEDIPLKAHFITKKLINLFIKRCRNKAGFDKLSYDVKGEKDKLYFIVYRNVKNTLLQAKRKRINHRDEIQ